MKLCDLHSHSTFSDGTFTPEQLINHAIDTGLSAIALTDHNTVAGLPRFLEYSRSKPIEAIPGCEFTVDYNGKEIHLLGLYIQEASFDIVNEYLKPYIRSKTESNILLINNLKKDGYNIEFENVKAICKDGVFNRTHVAKELERLGYVNNYKEAFDYLLNENGKYYKPARITKIYDMLKFLKELGIIPIIAHPFLSLTFEDLDELIPKAKEAGLIGLECLYSSFDEIQTNNAFYLAKKHGLYPSGGSDFHGETRPGVELGKGKGNLSIDFNLLIDIKKSVK